MKKHKLSRYVLTCLLGLVAIILLFLWVFIGSLFGAYYEYSKTRTAAKVSERIKDYYDKREYKEIIDILAYEESVCVDIIHNNQTIYTSDSFDRGCLKNRQGTTYKYRTDFELSGKTNQVYIIKNTVLNNQTLVYASKIDNNTFAYVNTSIEPVESSVVILKTVLLYITFMISIIAVILAFYLSKRISKPIISLNKKANHLAKSEFSLIEKDIDSNIYELEELNDTLNYASSELSKVDETRRDLLANVGHDLKTPLTMIKAYAELTRDLTSKDKKKSEENMNIIIEETDRLNNLVNDILELSKLQSGMKKVECDLFDVTELINSIIKRFNIYEEKEKFNFIFEYKEELLINADKQKIEQVIYNLINNAMNYTGDDKTVTIKIKGGVNNYRVSIIDTGKGIDPEEINVIWDKYYKNEKHHKRNKIGTGLGLSIVKEILLAHGYNYGVKSKKGHGSEFYFDIPKEKVK